MTKNELATDVARRLGISRDVAVLHIHHIFEAITDAVAKGDKVSLTGFGTFEKKHRAERAGTNPSTGAAITIPEAHVPAFRAGADFKDKVAG